MFDGLNASRVTSLQNDHGLTGVELMAEAMMFRQYVLGAAGPVGTDAYELRGYAGDDRDHNSLGQNIPLNLGLCEFP